MQLDTEQQARLLLYGATAAIIVLAVGLIAFGYYWSVVKPRHRTVLEADGEKVSYTAMVRRMEYEFYTSTVFQQQPEALPEATYLNLLNELTLIKRAESDLGVTVSAEDIDAKLRQKIGVGADADDQAFADRYRTSLKASGLPDGEYRRLARAEVLEQKVRAKFEGEAPASLPQAQIDVIAADEGAARDAYNRITAGEDFAAVAKVLSVDPDVQTSGGRQEFAPQGSFNAVFDEYVFNGPVGELSQPLAGPGEVFYVVRITAREDRPLGADQKPAYVTRKYSEWLSSTQEQMVITRDWERQAQIDALTKVLDNLDPTRNQQPQQPLTLPTVSQQVPAVPDDGAAPDGQ